MNPTVKRQTIGSGPAHHEARRGFCLEFIAFMEAADLSKQQGGAPVKLREVIKQAETAQR